MNPASSPNAAGMGSSTLPVTPQKKQQLVRQKTPKKHHYSDQQKAEYQQSIPCDKQESNKVKMFQVMNLASQHKVSLLG